MSEQLKHSSNRTHAFETLRYVTVRRSYDIDSPEAGCHDFFLSDSGSRIINSVMLWCKKLFCMKKSFNKRMPVVVYEGKLASQTKHYGKVRSFWALLAPTVKTSCKFSTALQTWLWKMTQECVYCANWIGSTDKHENVRNIGSPYKTNNKTNNSERS